MTIKESLQFEKNLYNLINSCGLSIDTAFYILKSVYLDFEKTVYNYATKESDNPITTEEQIYNIQNNPTELNISDVQVKDEKKENEDEQYIENASEYSGSIDDN